MGGRSATPKLPFARGASSGIAVISSPVHDAIERHDRLGHRADADTALLLVRHGRTAANRAGLFLGATDSPLDRFGEHQARMVAIGSPASGRLTLS